MTTGPSQPEFDLPAGMTEADMVDLVDGRLPKVREEAVLAALRFNPRIGLLARQMREDRGALGALATERAPAGLADAIEARLEAAALRDLAQAEAVEPSAVAEPAFAPAEPGVIRVLLESVWARRLATAAALLIVAGLGTVGFREAQRAGLLGGDSSRLARRPAAVEPDVPAGPAIGQPDAPSTAGPDDTALADAYATSPIDLDEPAGPASPGPAVAAAEGPGVAQPTALTAEAAAALAAEGRLVITVRAAPSAAGPAVQRLDRLARAAGREGGWEAMPPERVPPSLAALLTPSADATPGLPARPAPAAPVLAGDRPGAGPAPAGAEPAKGATFAPLRPVVRMVYAVQADPRAARLDALLKAVRDGLPEGATAAFRALEAPLPAPEVAVDPDSVLWWTGSPALWAPRTPVPVIVETLE